MAVQHFNLSMFDPVDRRTNNNECIVGGIVLRTSRGTFGVSALRGAQQTIFVQTRVMVQKSEAATRYRLFFKLSSVDPPPLNSQSRVSTSTGVLAMCPTA